jgi:hypothetical protein
MENTTVATVEELQAENAALKAQLATQGWQATIAAAKQTASESKIVLPEKNTVWMKESRSGVIGVGFARFTNDPQALLAHVTLIYRGILITGCSYRVVDNARGSHEAILPPSRSYLDKKTKETTWVSVVGFSRTTQTNILSDVQTAFKELRSRQTQA